MPREHMSKRARIIQMHEEGIRPYKIADKIPCARSYVSRIINGHEDNIIKQTTKERVEELLPDKTDQQRHFVEARASGMTKTEAAAEAYDVSSLESAKQIGFRLGRDPDLKVAIEHLMHQEGMGRRYRVQKLKQVVDSKDLGLAIRGLDTSFKLAGEFQSTQIDIQVNYDPAEQRERFSELKQLLAQSIAAKNDTDVIEVDN